MVKNKKKKAQMFKDFLAFKAGQNNPLQEISPPQASSFQTPHGNQERLTELIDDNAGGGSDKPSSSGANTNPGQTVNRWTALKPAEDAQIQVNMRQDPKRPKLMVVEGTASKIQLVMDKSNKTPALSASPKPAEKSKPDTPPTVAMPTASPQPTAQPRQSTNMPKQVFIAAPNNKIRYPPYTAPHKCLTQPHTYMAYPAGIPRSMLKPADIPKNIPTRTRTSKSQGVLFDHDEKSPSPQPNQTDQAENRNKPIWDLAPHAKPTWPTQPGPPHVAATGWPKSLNTSVPNVNWNPPEQGNDLSVQTDMNTDLPQPYSPSDVYSEGVNELHARKAMMQEQIVLGGTDEEAESPEIIPSGSKRLSAFQRLGPMAKQPKKTKLTINLLCEKDVRNVIDETDDIPTHLRDYITNSKEEIVVKYLEVWPFKKNVVPARTATVRQSKSVMMMEREYMEEAYTRDNRFILVAVTGYPPHWKKEEVLDAVLESVNGMSFIPCFIEFSRVQCRFLVIRCRLALLTIHKYGFIVRKNDVELIVSLSNIHLNLNQLDFVPRLMLRKLMLNKLQGDSLDLSNFTTQSDVSHFIYFPLDRVSNQIELIQLQSSVPWDTLTYLDLSHNRITSIIGIELLQITPNLRHLNLSHNCIEKATMLLCCRNLPLKSINLEGNPLCNDYIEQEHYIKVLTMLFNGLEEIDGVKFRQTHELPNAKRNYGPEESKQVIDKVLEVMFPLLDSSPEERILIEDLYREDAVLTITFMYKLRYGIVHKEFRNLFIQARVMDEGDMESVIGPTNIAKLIIRWPHMTHDPTTFNVDVLYHSDSTTIVRIGGIVRITSQTLADEHLLAFTRTLVLHTKNGSEYKITNELLYWDVPDKEYADTAFKITKVKPKNLNLQLDTPPDEEFKEKLLHVFMRITELEKEPSERCLKEKDWNIKTALEYFSKLMKLNNLAPIMTIDNKAN